MKKVFASLAIVAIVLFVGCSSDATSPSVVDFSIPDEFHGTWQSVETDPETGLNEVLRVSPGDIVANGASMRSSLNTMLDSYEKTAADYGIAFDVDFTESAPYEGRYSFALTMVVDALSTMQSCTMELVDGQLKVTLTVMSPDPDTGEVVNRTITTLYNPI